MAALLACISLLIWMVLLFARGGFWKVNLPKHPSAAASPVPTMRPRVAAIVPARNEVDVIGRAVTSLLSQRYDGDVRVIVVDDHSDDGTADAARAAAAALGEAAARRLHVVSARTLPVGWSGKVWAQSEGVAALAEHQPEAEWVWLTDADIVHPPHGLEALVARGIAGRLDLVSLMVRLRCESLAERLLIPAFVFFFAKLYPFKWIADIRRATAGAAGGCILLRRTALDRIGGMGAIKGALIDDCSLAAQIKRGGPIQLDLADEALSIRPYDGWQDIWRMIARTAYTQLRYSPWMLAGAALGMAVTYVVPPVLTIAGVIAGAWWAWPAALAWLAMGMAYGPMLRYYGQPAWQAVLLPGVAFFYLAATVDSGRRHWQGRGGEWKGRAQASSVLSAEPPQGPQGSQASQASHEQGTIKK
jgi:hopene-associated glycosyltransferase HpnB